MNNKEEQIIKDMKDKIAKIGNRYKTYTWEALSKFQELGIEGDVCMCNMKVANTMTVECIICGKIQQEYSKRYLRRKINEI